MKIDRTRFLVLTGALSAAACVVVDHKPPPPPPPPPPPSAATAATPARPHLVMNQPARPGTGPAPAPTPAHNIVFHGNTPVVPPPPAPGPTPTTPVPPPPAPTAACLDSGATTLPACSATCASNSFIAQRCATYAANFDAKVGAAAISCMNGLSGAAACDSSQAYNCGKTALSQACPDTTTVAQLCQIAATPCKVAQNDCVTMISGLNPAGQDAIATCVAKGCSAGLYSCVEGLTPNASTSATHH